MRGINSIPLSFLNSLPKGKTNARPNDSHVCLPSSCVDPFHDWSRVMTDLVFVLLNEYRHRIQPCIPSELQDIADDLGVDKMEVFEAVLVAEDILNSQNSHVATVDGQFQLISVDFEKPNKKGKKQ
jgi:hypothetical protein